MASLVATGAGLLSKISAVAGLVATGISAAGTIAAGNQAEADSKFEAAQLDAKGKEELASKQREAELIRRRRNDLLSTQQANAAESGLGTLDETVLDLAGDIYSEGEFRADSAIFEGEEARKGRNTQAASAILEGRRRKQGSRLAAAGTIIGGIGKFASSNSRRSFRASQRTGTTSGSSYKYA